MNRDKEGYHFWTNWWLIYKVNLGLSCSVVQKKGRGKKQQVSESSRLLNVLYNEGLRRQDLDADCRHFLETSPEDVKAKVRASSVSRLQ